VSSIEDFVSLLPDLMYVRIWWRGTGDRSLGEKGVGRVQKVKKEWTETPCPSPPHHNLLPEF